MDMRIHKAGQKSAVTEIMNRDISWQVPGRENGKNFFAFNEDSSWADSIGSNHAAGGEGGLAHERKELAGRPGLEPG
jgi:hypothetical protein